MSELNTPGMRTGSAENTLPAFLDHHREQLISCLDGVTEAEARAKLVPSKTSLLALVKHIVFVEGVWFGEALRGISREELGCGVTPDQSFDQLRPEDTIESVQAEARAAVADSQRRYAQLSDGLGHITHGSHRGELSMAWILTHMLREYAQHCGHADILREQLLAMRGTQ